ncbi:MAG TPA: hypothetical protein VMW40_08420 [Candidatus Bathyarchaeia archaeon]|nr:hypothetical protein [Candidatus Bathyarchaeia archaeon]
MGFVEWANGKARNMDIWDIGLTKFTMLFATLLIVKFWPAIVSLDWYWYLAAAVVVAIRPMYRFFVT